jgi:hypothetical protein
MVTQMKSQSKCQVQSEVFGFFLLLGGAFTTGQAAQRAPQKTTGLPLAGPDQARSLRLSPSRSTACRRDPRRHRTQHLFLVTSEASSGSNGGETQSRGST